VSNYQTINPAKHSSHYMMLFNCWRRIFLPIICFVYVNIASAEQGIANPVELSHAKIQQLKKDNLNVLGLLQLKQDAGVDFPLMEFSGLGWDEDEGNLIILSDRGYVIHTRPIFDNERLVKLHLLSYHALHNKKGKKLRYKASDSEGLALLNANNNIKGDTTLIVSFERQPRIIQFSVDGKYISRYPLNNELDDIKNYSSANKSLEAITLHSQFNIITGPERPLKKSVDGFLSLHTLDEKIWSITPENTQHGSLVGLTTLPDNRLIALERIYSSIFAGISNAIHLISLQADTLKQKRLVNLKSTAHYFNDNFEGITWHKNKRFFMISDDNDSLLQRSLLVYFEITNLD